ncbi:MAG: ABC transporter ATP-binding protein [Rhodospirillales bacterium]|nr:ABC transporter ATP-binding protein [Rhodospirillales bacterium]
MKLEVHKLDAFYGRAQILFGVTLKVAAGEALALLGRNGAGKSTMLRAILGLVAARRGRVVLDGRDISGMATGRIVRRGLGWVPEDRRIFTDLSVEENLEIGRQPPRAGVPHWTVERLFSLFPNLAEVRRRPAGQISGGEQQMLTISRTLMGNPCVIMLDEPSEGLAPLIVERMAVAVTEMKREGLGVLLAEQNLTFSRAVSDRATIIEKGRIRFEGTLECLLADEAVARAYLAV